MSKTEQRDWTKEARDDARETARNFIDEIVRSLLDTGAASDDLNNDYPEGDSYHPENHEYRDYILSEATELLDELSDYEETDSGLWEGQSPRQAICIQAAYTYGNAVYHYWRSLVREINDDAELSDLLECIQNDKDDDEGVDHEALVKAAVERIIGEF